MQVVVFFFQTAASFRPTVSSNFASQALIFTDDADNRKIIQFCLVKVPTHFLVLSFGLSLTHFGDSFSINRLFSCLMTARIVIPKSRNAC